VRLLRVLNCRLLFQHDSFLLQLLFSNLFISNVLNTYETGIENVIKKKTFSNRP